MDSENPMWDLNRQLISLNKRITVLTKDHIEWAEKVTVAQHNKLFYCSEEQRVT